MKKIKEIFCKIKMLFIHKCNCEKDNYIKAIGIKSKIETDCFLVWSIGDSKRGWIPSNKYIESIAQAIKDSGLDRKYSHIIVTYATKIEK